MNLYNYYSEPNKLYNYDISNNVPDLFWDKYQYYPEELKKREDYLAKSIKYSFKYAYYILNGRFLKGEDTIATDIKYAMLYAENLIAKMQKNLLNMLEILSWEDLKKVNLEF